MSAPTGFTLITASKIQDASGHPLAAGRVTFFPVSSPSGGPISAIAGGGGGLITQTGVPFLVVNGAITTDLNGNTPQLADTTLTTPADIAYKVTVTDANGKPVQGPGYGLVQPSSGTWSLDTYTPVQPLQVTVQSGPAGLQGIQGPVGPAGGALNTNANGWAINLNGQVFYTDGSSLERAPHSGGTYVSGSSLPGGGLAGNYTYLLSQMSWANGRGTYYNDAVDGGTSAMALARYTTGNSTYGVTVPSPHSVSPAVTGSSARAIYYLGLSIAYNDANSGVSQATSIANIQAIVNAAKADGYLVVLMTTSITFPGNTGLQAQMKAVMKAAVSGQITNVDLVARIDLWLDDQTDQAYFDTDNLHYIANGHEAIAKRMNSFMISGGGQDNASQIGMPSAASSSSGTFGAYTFSSGYLAGLVNICQAGDFTPGSNNGSFAILSGNQASNPVGIYGGVSFSALAAYIVAVQANVGNIPLCLNPTGGMVYINCLTPAADHPYQGLSFGGSSIGSVGLPFFLYDDGSGNRVGIRSGQNYSTRLFTSSSAPYARTEFGYEADEAGATFTAWAYFDPNGLTIINGEDVLTYASTVALNPVFLSNSVTLTGAVTFTCIAGHNGAQDFHLDIFQDGTGGRTCTFPSNMDTPPALTTTANTHSALVFHWSPSKTKWILHSCVTGIAN